MEEFSPLTTNGIVCEISPFAVKLFLLPFTVAYAENFHGVFHSVA